MHNQINEEVICKEQIEDTLGTCNRLVEEHYYKDSKLVKEIKTNSRFNYFTAILLIQCVKEILLPETNKNSYLILYFSKFLIIGMHKV